MAQVFRDAGGLVGGAVDTRTTGGGHAYLAMTELGTPDVDITLVVDVEEHLVTRWAAIRAHDSQASPYDDLPEELQHDFLAQDRLRLVRAVETCWRTVRA